MPKLAVKRMQKATIPIIHMSSGFIVRVLLILKGTFVPLGLDFFDHDHGFLLGARICTSFVVDSST